MEKFIVVIMGCHLETKIGRKEKARKIKLEMIGAT